MMTKEEVLAEVKGTLETWLCGSYAQRSEADYSQEQHYIAGLLNAPEDPPNSLTLEVREERHGGGEVWLITIDAKKVSSS